MKVITDKDGRMQTAPHSDAAAQAKLAQTRKELRDMLAGNTQFHTDALGPAPKVPEPDVLEVFEPFGYLSLDDRLVRIAEDMRRDIEFVCGIRHA